MRGSAIVESAGVPSVSLVCDGFAGQAATTARGLGIDGLPIARIPGHVDGQSIAELTTNVLDVTVSQIVHHLTHAVTVTETGAQVRSGTVIAEGDFDQINAHFYEQRWSDGLPIVQP
jgi:hypothetical protein